MATARLALLASLILFGCAAFAPLAATAQGADLASIAVVRGVSVSASAADPTTARTRAIEEGRGEAFRRLIAAIEEPDARARLARLSEADAARLLEGYEIEKETPTDGRYIATVAYRFRPAALRRILDEREAPPVVGPDALVARVSFGAFEEWTELRKRVAGAPAVRGFAVRGLNRTEAVVELKLSVTPEQAAQALAARDVTLEQDEGGWRLRLGVSKPAPAAAAPTTPAAPAALTPSQPPQPPAPTPALAPAEKPVAGFSPAPPLPAPPSAQVAPAISFPPAPEALVGAPAPSAPPANEVVDAPPPEPPPPAGPPAAPPGFSIGRGPVR